MIFGCPAHGKKLHNEGYRFPSTLLSTFGLKHLCGLIEQEKIRAVDIPNMLQEVLHLELDKTTEIDEFHKHRAVRNNIAHGTAAPRDFSLPNAVRANDFLRNLALKVDRHVVEFFLVIEIFE